MLGPIFRCSACGTIFIQCGLVDPIQPPEDDNLGCPHCYSGMSDWDMVPDQVIWHLFTAIYGASFSSTRRMALRTVAESHMGPYSPISRDL